MRRSPLHGASIADLKNCRNELGLPEYDLYGAFFYQRKQMLDDFRKVLSTRKINIDIYLGDAIALSNIIKGQQKQGDEYNGTFDRIDISNMVDEIYLGVKLSLQTFIPLLKSKTINPNATLTAYFMKTGCERKVPRDLKETFEQFRDSFLQEEWKDLGPRGKDFYRQRLAIIRDILWPPWRLFNRYCIEMKFDEAAKESEACMRSENLIGPKWPMRHFFKTRDVREDVQMSLGPFHWKRGNIRFAEWHRV